GRGRRTRGRYLLTRLSRVSGRRLVRVLERGGFEVVHVRGSHHYLRREGEGVLVVVPVHGNRDLPTGPCVRSCGRLISAQRS
ncbi:MAG: type II toxin-antitoxin system HicA family toxin, partial [Actinomycetota bacterium]